MSTKDDGGPAFPCEQHEKQNGGWNQTFEPGMTLRDYFAAKAMQGALAGNCFDFALVEDEAKFAYRIADAMINVRQQ